MRGRAFSTAGLILAICILGQATTAYAERQQEITTCKRKWYCLWACKKCTTTVKWCYDFSSIHTSCRVFSETLHGCEAGTEYRWKSGCFGWFEACLDGRTVCFTNRRSSRGDCSKSLCDAPVVSSVGESSIPAAFLETDGSQNAPTCSPAGPGEPEHRPSQPPQSEQAGRTPWPSM